MQILRILRQKRKMSLRDVAKNINISASHLSNLENGRRHITHTEFVRIIDFYGYLVEIHEKTGMDG